MLANPGTVQVDPCWIRAKKTRQMFLESSFFLEFGSPVSVPALKGLIGLLQVCLIEFISFLSRDSMTCYVNVSFQGG